MASAERGMSAPPEVVFNTATDPDRASAWLPEPLRADGSPADEISGEELRARWSAAEEWSAEIRVEPGQAGGARMRLDLTGGPDAERLADEALDNLAREVADNLQAG
ncbi:hypothetical protein OG777_23490 [Micromonospora peucetia]|uniref:Polyketide cyclase / dehydrase and lipid transport n=1 Tax=Micromonospora peucetia TaxID=47871 RepID=A0A1C6VHY2_9ACTN|nr:hypothetical protein [Micromonospora peucetia]MCX4389876.1 hypothetical protein [Micromonospora peucetia]WSA30339.1 hypothetical protein OIE14_19255 [Micromonospora peucetia]SCL65827.1 hypothetical protein GA0070608_3175 [Micromonospora peucetia]